MMPTAAAGAVAAVESSAAEKDIARRDHLPIP